MPLTPDQPIWRKALLVAALAVAVSFTWEYLHVRYLYGGNWTSVYYTGALMRMPDELDHESIYKFPGVIGYDGQLYHLISHDPLFQRGFASYLDHPRLRYRRILVPALAALLSFGRPDWVDAAYIGTIFGFVFLGSFWLASWSASHGRSVLWGLLFVLTPAALVSILTMVIDVSLAALTIAFVWYVERQAPFKLFAVLACAALARETGVLLLLGWGGWLLLNRQWGRAAAYSLAGLPLAAWMFFVNLHTTASSDRWISPIPFFGIVDGLVHPFRVPNQSPVVERLLITLSQLALIGMLLAIFLVIRACANRKDWTPQLFVASGFVLLAAFLGYGEVWPEVSAFGRNFTPLLLIVAMPSIRSGTWAGLLPLAMIVPRIAMIYVHHTAGIARSIIHGAAG